MRIHYQLKKLSGDTMKVTFVKTIFRDFKKNFTRLIAIVAIMALGVGFLIGLLSATPNLQDSMERYYDDTNTYDILLKSTIGFSEQDISRLKEDVLGIEDIEAFSAMDYKTHHNSKDITARVITSALPSRINQIELIAGRYPTQAKECIVHNMGIYLDKTPLDEEILIEGVAYKIVGVCNSPVYYYRMQENTQIGNGNLDVILYLDSAYTESSITDIAITLSGAKKLNSFTSSYFKFIETIEKNLKNVEEAYIFSRLEDLYKEAVIKELEKLNIPITSEIVEAMLAARREEIVEAVNQELPIEKQWYILNRKSNLSYISFEANSAKVNNVAVVFPFFFFFIAALIALTSVSRLVQEDRSSIGTLKSLGYSNGRILNKYFIYALFACLVGSVGGLFLGVYAIPMVIYFCYNSLFVMPVGHFSWYAWTVLLASLTMSFTIFMVMLAVCLKALKEKPNALLVPKAPKAGKRILLERIDFLWKRLKFKYKSSIRNIFRFKRNLIMMIVGVGGCTGLMLVGLGLRDSLNGSSKRQFEEILKYDFSVGVQEEIPLDFLQDSSYMYLYKETGEVKGSKEYEVNLLYTDDSILNYMELNVKSLPKDSVIISSQLAEQFHLRKGDNIVIEVEGREKSFLVSSIFTNYIDNYIIASNPDEKINTMLIKLGTLDKENYEVIVEKIYEAEVLTNVTDLAQSKKLYSSLSNGIELVVLLIIFCSGLLAIIVIYNLTNININERIKEIATLKVLGYQRAEVLGYI
ncbi:MAG: FtsX-like permease family protein, partial [Anaeroplasmataceae bacterium]|nr:FtsX-like permease family protein [Anaeroplasmataceae bacterium]